MNSNTECDISTKQLSKTMYYNVIANYGLRGLGIVLGLYSTRVNLDYLGVTLFGLWATIASIATWVNYCDFGIGNGVRNKLSEVIAKGDREAELKLIITARRTMFLLSLGLLFGLIIVTEFLFAFNIMESFLRIPMYITNIFFCMDMFFGIGRFVALSKQASWLTSLAQSLTVSLRIIGVLCLGYIDVNANLTAFALLTGSMGTLANIILIEILYYKYGINLFARENNMYDGVLNRGIISLGAKFFLIQISCLILYSTDNVIINKIFSSEAVAKYTIINTVFMTGENLFSILLVSFWSAVTYAVTQGDYKWIKMETRRLLLMGGIYSIGVIIVGIFFNDIVRLWLNNDALKYEFDIILLFVIYNIWRAFGSIYVNISNGMGRLKIQMIFAVIVIVVNIPLSVFLSSTLGLGILGIKLATLCCLIGSNLFVPLDIIHFLFIKCKEE